MTAPFHSFYPLLVWLLLSTIWGSTWLFIKIGLQDLPPFTFAGLRFALAAPPILILLLWRRPALPANRQQWGLIALTGVLVFAINYALVFWGENFISSGLTAILYSTFQFFGLIFAHFLIPAEQMTLKKMTGVLLGISGVVIIFWKQLHIANVQAVWGSAAVVLAALVSAYANVLIKMRGKGIDPFVLTAGQMLVGVGPLLLTGILLEGNPLAHNWNGTAWLALLYLALVGSSLAFVLLYWLIHKVDVTKTHLIPLASTVVAVILGRIFLGEELSTRTVIGGASILLGLGLSSWGFRPPSGKQTRVSAAESSYLRQV